MRYLIKCAYLSCMAIGVLGCDQQRVAPSQLDIVGGRKVTLSDPIVKSTVGLVRRGTLDTFCTGSLINPKLVLTAAHCIVGAEENGYEIDVAFGNQVGGHQIIAATQAVRHHNYDESAMYESTDSRAPNDIGILLLDEPSSGEFMPIQPMTLRDDVKEGEDLILAGFGITHAGSDLIDGALRKVITRITRLHRSQKEIEFGDVPGVSACEGDSGGPAFVARDGTLRLVGVTSRGSAKCDESGIYTDVRYFSDWIKQQTSSVRF